MKKFAKTMRTVLAYTLAFVMMLGVCSTPIALIAKDLGNSDMTEKDTISYVALGASNTNGFGLMGYLPDELYGNPVDKMSGSVYGYQMEPEKAYPSLVANALKDLTGKEVELEQLAISSMRAEELHVLLDNDYYGDKYTEWRFTAGHNWFNMAHPDGLDGLRAEYQNYVANADVITVDIGANNFGVYASNRIFNNMFDADFTRFDEGTQRDIAAVKAEIEKLLNEYVSGVLTPELSRMLDHIVDAMTYALVGFCVNFDASMERIYELNPDATVVVVNIQNLMHGLYATLPGMDEPFAFGEFYGAIVNMANTYIATVSPYADQYYCAYIGEDGQAETFLTDIKGYTGNPEDLRTAVSDCFDVYDNDMYLKTRVLQAWLTKYIGVVSIVDNKYPVNDLANLNKFGAAVYNEEILVAGTPLKDFLAYGEAGALAQVDPMYQAAYDEYKAMLLTAYDAAATFMQLGANSTVMDLAAAAANFATVGKNVLGTFFTWLLYGIENPGFDVTQAPALPYYEDDTIMCPSYEEVINDPTYMAIITLGVRSDLGNSFFSHPNENGHVEIKDAIINALENEISGKEIVLETAIDLIVKYYDDAYAYGYAYALENGYVDEAIAAIDAAIAAINGVDLDAAGLTAELEAKANAELTAVAATLEELKAVLANNQAADIDGLVDSVLALEDDLYTHLNNVEAVLAQAGVDVNNLVIIPALKEAERYIKEEAIPAAKDAAKAAAEQTYAYLTEALENAYADLVEAIKAAADKYLPMADEALYNYFYNNPEEVIEFFKNYGPCIAQAVADNGEIALAILGFIFVNYGEDIATYVFNNSDTILSALVAWSDTYGDRTVQMLQVYAEALGLCDAVRDQIENLEDQLAALEDALEFAVGEVKAEIEAKIAEVQAAIEELEAALQEMICSGLTAVEALKDVVLNLDDAVAALVESLKDVTAQSVIDAVQNIVKAADAIDAYLEEMLGEKYEDLKEELSELGKYVVEQLVDAIVKFFPVADELLYNYFYNNPDEVIAFFETYGPAMLDIAKEYGDEALAVVGYVLYVYGDEIAAYVIENRAEVLAGIEGWVEKYGERTAKMLQVYAEALGLCDAVRDQIEILEDQLAALENALEFAVGEVKAEIEAKIAEVKAAIEELKAALEAIEEAIKSVVSNVNNKIENAIAEIEQAIKDLEAKVEALVEDVKNQVEAALVAAITAGLEELNELIEELTEKITDELMQIVEKLIYDATHGEYVIDNDSFYVGLGDSSAVSQSYVDALAALLKLDYANLAQAGHTTTDTLDVIAQNAALIGKADLVTIGYTANIFTAEVVYTIQNILMGDPVEEYDWEALVTEGGVQYVEKALAEIHAKFVEQGLDIVVSGRNMADALTAAVEAYAYAYVEHLLTYPAIVNAIHEIAPEALVVIVGLHNTVENIVIDIEGTEIALGEYVQYTVDAANVVSLVNAILAENTVFVNTPDVETLKEEKGDSLNYDMISFVFEAILTNGADFATSEAGHAYILDQILNALTIIDNRTGLLGDADSDGDVDSTDAMLVLQYDALLIGEDQLDLSVCDVDGDGDVDSTDAMLILQYDALLIEVFPVEA